MERQKKANDLKTKNKMMNLSMNTKFEKKYSEGPGLALVLSFNLMIQNLKISFKQTNILNVANKKQCDKNEQQKIHVN